MVSTEETKLKKRSKVSRSKGLYKGHPLKAGKTARRSLCKNNSASKERSAGEITSGKDLARTKKHKKGRFRSLKTRPLGSEETEGSKLLKQTAVRGLRRVNSNKREERRIRPSEERKRNKARTQTNLLRKKTTRDGVAQT